MARKPSKAANSVIQSVIVKKCDRTRHNPDRNKACAARDAGAAKGKCQHTCEPAQVETCAHKWTVIYQGPNGQREISYATRDEAEVFQLDLSAKKRTQGRLFVDPRAGAARFGDMLGVYMSEMDAGQVSKDTYMSHWRGSGAAAMLDHLPCAVVAKMEAEVRHLVNVTLLRRHRNYRGAILRLITGTLDLAVRRSVIPGHTVTGIELAAWRQTAEEYAAAHRPWVFLSDAQVRQVAGGQVPGRRPMKGLGIAAWLMRCCGARIGEALGACKSDFVQLDDGSRVWRLRWQAADDGRSLVPLKHRPAGEGRDIPVPDFVWEMIQAMDDGPLCPGLRTRFLPYNTAWNRGEQLAKVIAPGWHAHNLRHQYASEEAEDGANIADLAETLGHASPRVTFDRYVRALPGRIGRTAARMNTRWPARPRPGRPAGTGRQAGSSGKAAPARAAA